MTTSSIDDVILVFSFDFISKISIIDYRNVNIIASEGVILLKYSRKCVLMLRGKMVWLMTSSFSAKDGEIFQL